MKLQRLSVPGEEQNEGVLSFPFLTIFVRVLFYGCLYLLFCSVYHDAYLQPLIHVSCRRKNGPRTSNS